MLRINLIDLIILIDLINDQAPNPNYGHYKLVIGI